MSGSLHTAAPMAALALGWVLGGCADQVVGSFDPATGSGSGSGSGEPTATAQSDETTLGPADDSGEPPVPEQCNGLDDDHDGLVDEVSAELVECNGCQLLQGEGQAWWVCTFEKAWTDAQAFCEGFGATTAIVPSEAAQAFLHEQIGQGWFWLGAIQDPDEGPWRWVDGTAFDYANWGTTQPDDIAPGQDCVRLTFGIIGEGWFDGAWDDFFCEEPHPVLCSAPHELL